MTTPTLFHIHPGTARLRAVEAHSARSARLSDQSGFALFATLLMVLLLASLGSASLIYSSIDLQGTTHYRTGTQAFSAAESGALHALSTINQRMVTHFKNDIVDEWNSHATLLGPGTRTMMGDPASEYSVTVEADPTAPRDQGRIRAIGRAPREAERRITLRLRRSPIVGSAGAIYAYEDGPITADFNGNNFVVDGNDHLPNGNPDPRGIVKPGIATRNPDNQGNVVAGMGDQERDNVKGLGWDDTTNPKTPSVLGTGGPSSSDINSVVNDILNRTPTCPPGEHGTHCVTKLSGSNINGSELEIGTQDNPAIIQLTNTGGVKVNGNWSGWGILIVDGPFDMNGTANFFGWIIARKGFDSKMNGNATVRGTVWTKSNDLKIGGSLIVDYCSTCLEVADRAGLNVLSEGGNFPRTMEVVAWAEE